MTAPRIWRGKGTQIQHWWWNRVHEPPKWVLCSDKLVLAYSNIFLPPQATAPTEPPGDNLEECSTIDWGPDAPGEPDELTALRERVAELEKERMGTRQRVVDRDQCIAELQEQLDGKSARVAKLESDADSIEQADRIQRGLEDKLDSRIRKMRDLEARVKVLERAIHSVCTGYAGDSGTSVNEAAFQNLAALWKAGAKHSSEEKS